MRQAVLAAAVLLFSSAVFISCSKDDDFNNNPPAAGLMAFNLSTDRSPIGFTLSGNQFGNSPLYFTNYTGAYLPVYIGTREVRSFDYNSGSTIALSNTTFNDSSYYSVFLMGADGNYSNVVVEDKLDSLTVSPGKSWVRYVNAVPDSASTPVITVNGDEVEASAAYRSVSSFVPVTSGSVVVNYNNHVDTPFGRTISLEENKVYTLLFVGKPGAADSTLAPQVRFIQNGTVTP